MELIVLDTSFNKVKILDVFDSLIWTDRYSLCGDFELLNKPNADLLYYLKEDYLLILPGSEHLMIIESLNLKTDVEEGDKFITSGRSLESILDRRIIWNQTVLSGSLHDGIKRLLNENAINPEDPDRKILRLVFEESVDPTVLALSIDNQYFGENLYDVISELCVANKIGFKITLSEDNNFVFKLYSGVDRSFSQIINPFVAFSPKLDNLSNTNYFHSKMPFKTTTLVGGEGEGSDKIKTEVSLEEGLTDLNRREKYTDASDTSTLVDGVVISPEEYYSLLLTRGIISLLESLPISAFDGQIDTKGNYSYGVDYFMGDIVQIENEYGLTGKSRVTELVFSEDLSGSIVYPTFEVVE